MINERKLTEKELEKREVALKGLLQNKQSLVKKYGKEAEKVMYGIATKQAKSKVEAMNLDKIKETIEGLDIGSKVKIAKEYGGGKGTVEDIKGSFVVVKTKKGNESYHESDLKPVEERIKELIVKSLTKEDNDPSGEYLEGDPDEKVEERIVNKKYSEFSVDETRAIAKETMKAVQSALEEKGEKVTKAYSKVTEPNDFDIRVEYDRGVEDNFNFYINEDDTLHLVDFSFDKELVDVGVKPSGEAVVNVDELTKKLVEHFKSMREDVNDPVLMKMRATDSKPKINPAFKAIKNASKIEMLQNKRAEIMMDMEQEAEPEGGPIANKYGRMLTKVDDAIEKLGGNPMSEDLDIGHEDNEPQMLKAELARAGQMVQMLYRAIDKYDGQGEVDFPQWWQKKIIQANTMLDSAFDYIDGKEKVAQIDAVIDMVGEVTTDDEFAASEEAARLEKHPEKDLINKIKDMMSKEKIKEKLTKKSSVDKHIEDFKDSDAPQFKGKSDKKKVQMAVASFLAKQGKGKVTEAEEKLQMTYKGDPVNLQISKFGGTSEKANETVLFIAVGGKGKRGSKGSKSALERRLKLLDQKVDKILFNNDNNITKEIKSFSKNDFKIK